MTRTTNKTAKYTTLGLLATLAATVSTPVLADQQGDKNNLRNLAIAGAAVAGYGLLSHNNTATLLGAAGAVIAGSQYENVRQQQSQDNGYYDGHTGGRFYHRTGDNGYSGNGGGYYTNAGRYNNDGSQWRSDDNSSRDRNRRNDDRSHNNDNRNRGGWSADARHDNGQHRDDRH